MRVDLKKPHPNPLPEGEGAMPSPSGRGRGPLRSSGRVRVSLFAAMMIGTTLLAGCGRKDYPDYPPDAIERPGTLERRSEPVRYY